MNIKMTMYEKRKVIRLMPCSNPQSKLLKLIKHYYCAAWFGYKHFEKMLLGSDMKSWQPNSSHMHLLV